MSARIRTSINGTDPLDEQSREDVSIGDIITPVAIDSASTYSWELSFVPEGSTATFSGASTNITPGHFTIDLEGPYLIKLTVDAGLLSESTQYVRVRVLTSRLGLRLVAGGERRDPTAIVPVDIDIEGWANEQNANLQALETAATTPSGSYTPYLFNLPIVGNTTVCYEGWVTQQSVLSQVTVKCGTINTQGSYTLDVQNITTGNSCLSVVVDMNTLVSNTVTDIPLTSVSSDLDFTGLGIWKVSLTSDNVNCNADDVYVQLSFIIS